MNADRDFNVDTLQQSELFYTFTSRPRGTNETNVIFHYGPDTVTPEYGLSMGYKEYDYMIDITIIIEDKFGEATTCETSVQVNEKLIS